MPDFVGFAYLPLTYGRKYTQKQLRIRLFLISTQMDLVKTRGGSKKPATMSLETRARFIKACSLVKARTSRKLLPTIRFQVNQFTVWKSNGRRNFNFRPALAAAGIYMYFCYQIPCVGTPKIAMYDTTCDLFWLESVWMSPNTIRFTCVQRCHSSYNAKSI